MRQRVLASLPGDSELESKIEEIHLGVATREFTLVPRSERPASIRRLLEGAASLPRGRSAVQTRRLWEGLLPEMAEAELTALFDSVRDYDAKAPDADLEQKLDAVDWEREKVLLFVGRLISTKGIHAVIMALPFLLEARPDLRLVVVGHGPLREPLEAMLWAMERGDRVLLQRIVARGVVLEGSIEGGDEASELAEAARFLERLRAEGRADRYFDAARRLVRADRVLFTGYLTHHELHHLFPCCDAAIFPSVVKEAGPLVFLEAIASGAFPLGTYFGGMKASIDTVAEFLPAQAADLMKLDSRPEQTVEDIVRHAPRALVEGEQHREVLNRVARERFDWSSVASRLRHALERL